ncbi:MAG: hypothetical protein ABSB49_16580 [Polyangia bacterium]|jgi:hypothetical protein
MLNLLRDVTLLAAHRALRTWPVAISFLVYAAILVAAATALAPLGMIGGMVLGLVMAACWSSYLELAAQAVAGSRIRLSWPEFRRTFAARIWDVVSVMFAFWIISLLMGPALRGPDGERVAAVFGLAVAFFFNAVPELLYQGHSRSFALLLDSGRFMIAHPVVWLLPNLVFAALLLLPTGRLAVARPAELLLVFANTFSSPLGLVGMVTAWPIWTWPLILFGLHYAMVFRGLLFQQLTSGTGSARMRAFRAKMQG